MRFTTKVEYGIISLIYVTQNFGRKGPPVTIKELAKAERYSRTYIEKILQTLRQAKILKAEHGNQGGYRLARHPSQITLKEVIEALEGTTFESFCQSRSRKSRTCNHDSGCHLKAIWENTRKVLDDFFDSMTLEMIVDGK